MHLWSAQRTILESVRDHRKTAVRSGHGVGKTFVAAAAVLWFLLSFPRSRVVTTASTWSQVEKLLWHEIGRLHARARFPLGGELLNTQLRLDTDRYAIGLSTRPEHLESFQGHHAPSLLLVFDEASGIPAAVFEAGEGYMTSAGARWLMIGNPLRPAGEFHAAFHANRAQWSTHAISVLDSPAFTGEPCPPEVLAELTSRQWVEERRRAWGEGSPLYQARVLGAFPAAASDAVVPLAGVEEAQARELPADPGQREVVVACDVARFGTDETVIAVRVGDQVRLVDSYVGRATTHTAGRILDVMRRYPEAHTRAVVDDDGVGGGVTDQLREAGVEVAAFRGGETAFEPWSYPNRRSELWFAMADRLPSLDLDADEQLAADLTAPTYRFDGQGRRVVERKEETRKRLGRSPDRGDAVLLTLVPRAASVVEDPWALPPVAGSLTSGLMGRAL